MKKPKDDKVGYGKPPKDTRFKKGKSGNPAGRPKSNVSQNLRAILEKVLAKRVTMKEGGGRTRKVSLLEGILSKQATLAAADTRASKQLMDLLIKLNAKELAEDAKAPLPWSDDDGVVEPEI